MDKSNKRILIALVIFLFASIFLISLFYFFLVPVPCAKPELFAISHNKVPATTNQYEVTIQNNGGAMATIESLDSIDLTNETMTTPINPTAIDEDAITITFPAYVEQGEQVIWIFTFSTNLSIGCNYVLIIYYDAGFKLTIEFIY
jgi:hypothetical protein